MLSDRPGRAGRPIGPSGELLTLDDLPPPDIQRWVPRRKAELVAAVRGGLITMDYACERYQISREEFLTWAETVGSFGVKGLRSTRLQLYRKLAEKIRD